MLNIFLRKLGMLLLSTLVLLLLTFWFYIRANGLGEQNLYLQFMMYLERILRLNFGYSSQSSELVMNEFLTCIEASAELILIAMIFAVSVGFKLGCYAALHKDKLTDTAITNASIFCSSIPVFWIAQLLISSVAVYFDIIPSSGRISLLYNIQPVTGFILIDTLLYSDIMGFDPFFNALSHFILPAITLALLPTTEIIRIVRNSLYGIMQQNYIKIAFSRGWSASKIISKHGVKNAFPAIITQANSVIFLTFTSMVIIENIFNWPGVGYWIVEAFRNRDINVINAYLVLVGMMFIIINILIDFMSEVSILFREKRSRNYA